MFGALSLCALLRVRHPEGLANSCSHLNEFDTHHSLSVRQFSRSRGRQIRLSETSLALFQLNLLPDVPIDVSGKIALAANEAKLDP
eukprot:3877266-Rhodomonas_salina.1